MIHFDLPKQKSSIIKVFGIGGGGSNAVNYMYSQDIDGVDFVVCNTDAKAIEQSPVLNKIQLGPASTQGLGAGANPEVGKTATEESLQEIKSILEVNTRMAFITAGMGGGTGTGGAPIVAQMCKEMGILTVGIVTTPFGFEGPRRMEQAKEGIKALKPHVDTLLVISNDKLRMQYGNLKMREAFAKADNVLATAAKCITDIISSKGHIIVDFADVCTVMKNGGVAVLGSSAAEGEDRAQQAIEEALNSPLLNDSEIKGAKWILININSAEGDHECTMDELEIISNHLRSQAGDNTDVIVGMGTDNTLDKKIGITLIATGFEHKDPFVKQVVVKEVPVVEKVVMTLDLNANLEAKKPIVEPINTQQAIPFTDINPYAPQLIEQNVVETAVVEVAVANYINADFEAQRQTTLNIKETEIFELELQTEQEYIVDEVKPNAIAVAPQPLVVNTMEESVNAMSLITKPDINNNIVSKPSNIYVSNVAKHYSEEIKVETPIQNANTIELTIEQPKVVNEVSSMFEDEENNEDFAFEIVNKVEAPIANNYLPANNIEVELTPEEEQRKRAQDRIQKLRSLSYNMKSTDNSEFENVPAYVRRNMELFGSGLNTAETFYSNITVGKDANNNTEIRTINNFLEGPIKD
jgi:cell division protein FtsZ